jgi:two-component system OmpR family sensor kinase
MHRFRGAVARLAVSNWSLRFRLLVVAVGLCALALVVTGTIGIALLRGYLAHQVDRQLMVGATRLTQLSETAPRRPVAEGSTQLPTPFIFTALSPSGAIQWQAGGLAAGLRPDLSGLNTADVRAKAGKTFTVPSVDGKSSFRVQALERSDGSGTATVAVSLQSVDATVRRMEMITWLVASLVLVLLIVLASAAVRLGLRPLRVVEETAETIAAGDLSQRIPVGSTPTEIGRLSRTLNGMLGQIEAAFAAREQGESTLRQFVADASHELRTPLTTVRGYAELARKGALADDDARQQAMRRIEAEAARMGLLVEDLLLLAHLDQRRPLDVTTVDLDALAADAVSDARVRAPDRPIEYTGPGAAVLVEAEADRLRQVLANLLGNALTHTPARTAVHVSLCRQGNEVRLVVADEGPGVAPDQVPKLFERFYRTDGSRSRSRGGNGLGLSIVQAIVRASGGEVSCTSTLGAGTAFTITLPEAAASHS